MVERGKEKSFVIKLEEVVKRQDNRIKWRTEKINMELLEPTPHLHRRKLNKFCRLPHVSSLLTRCWRNRLISVTKWFLPQSNWRCYDMNPLREIFVGKCKLLILTQWCPTPNSRATCGSRQLLMCLTINSDISYIALTAHLQFIFLCWKVFPISPFQLLHGLPLLRLQSTPAYHIYLTILFLSLYHSRTVLFFNSVFSGNTHNSNGISSLRTLT